MRIWLRTSVCLAALYLLALSPGILHASPVVSANKENNAEVEGYSKIHAICYHVKSTSAVNTALGKTQYGKPIVISDDGARASTSQVSEWTGLTKNAGQHYEHLSDALVECSGGAWTGCAQRGKAINGASDFPSESKTNLAKLGSHATPLAPYGTLSTSGGKFHWNGQQVTLMGFSWYGAMIGKNCNIPGYLGVLQSYGVNFTRVWVIDMWTALAEFQNYNNGVLPFTGSFGSYNLTQLNEEFMTRMKQFVDEAWARGIVVQLVLFDRCGLQCGVDFRFKHSPYNTINNVNGFLPNCSSGYPNFCQTDGTNIGNVNRALIQRIVQELQGRGNVLYEIMNEPGGVFSNEVAWHKWVADVIHESYDNDPPSVPTNLQGTSWGSTLVELTWTASTDNVGVAGYKVFRNGTQIATPTTPYYLDTGRTASTSYTYTVLAYDGAGNESAQTSPVVVTTLAHDSQPPSVPSNVQASGVSNSSILVSWTASTDNRGVLGYKVFRNGSLVQTLGTTTSYTDTGLTQGTTYSYRVSAFDGDGNESAQSAVATGTTLAPISITNLVPSNYVVTTFNIGSLTFIDRDFTISTFPTRHQGRLGIRTANNDKDNTNLDFRFDVNQPVEIYLCMQDPMQPTTPLLTGFVSTGESFTTSDVGTNTYRIFRKSYPAGQINLGPKPGAGDGKSMYFVLVGYSEDSQAPSVPTSVSAAAQSDTSILVTWTASTDNVAVTGYKVFRNGAQVATPTATSYTDTGLAPLSTYSYTVSAHDAAGNNSAQSSPPAVASTPDTTPPSVPTGVAATALSGSEIQVTWIASTDNVAVTGYRIFRNGSPVGTTAGSTTYTDSGLEDATTYTYTVSAFDGASNESAQSAPATAMTFDEDPPSVPADVQGVSVTPLVVKLTWSASTDNAGVAGYRIYRNGSQIGTATDTEFVDSGLAAGTTYSYTVSAYDEADNESAQSSPLAVATLAAMDIAEAKLQGDTASVGFVAKRVSALLDDCFYIQEDDRYSGIKIIAIALPDGLVEGSIVDIGGVIDTDSDGERFILGNVILN